MCVYWTNYSAVISVTATCFGMILIKPSSSCSDNCTSLIKQYSFLTLRYRYNVLQQTERTWPILNRATFHNVTFLQKHNDRQFFVDTTFWQKACPLPNCLVTRESVWRIVWDTTNSRFMKDTGENHEILHTFRLKLCLIFLIYIYIKDCNL